MLRIRLTRVGKKKKPAYRLVVADSRSPRDGAFVEIIGHYDPLQDPANLTVKEERAVDWLKKGARPSDTAAKLLSRLGILEKAGLPPLPTAPTDSSIVGENGAEAQNQETESEGQDAPTEVSESKEQDP